MLPVCAVLAALVAPAYAQYCAQTIALAPGQTATNSFGASVALTGDFALVGDPDFESGANPGPGHVSVYTRHPVGGHLLFDAQIAASDGLAGDQFGIDCDVDGDRIVVGADGHDAAGLDAGAAYVLERVQGQWVEVQKLTSPTASSGDRFGATVAIEGEWMLVSAPGGSEVFVYRHVVGAWTVHQVIVLSNASSVGGLTAEIDQGFFAVANLNRALAYEWNAVTQLWELDFHAGTASAFSFTGMAFSADRVVIARSYGLVEVYERNTSTGIWGVPRSLDAPMPGAVAQTGQRILVMVPTSGLVRTFVKSGSQWISSTTAPGGRLGSNAIATHGASSLVSGPVTPTLYQFECGSVGAVQCTQSVTNSTGSTGSLQAFGSTDVAVNQLELVATVLPEDAFGLFLTSRTPGFSMTPGNAVGDLCLSGAIGRYVGPGQIQSTGAAGGFQLALDLTAMPTPTGSVGASAGETWYFQAWHRDANPQPQSNFTHSVSVLLR